jgi:hypothetical protein
MALCKYIKSVRHGVHNLPINTHEMKMKRFFWLFINIFEQKSDILWTKLSILSAVAKWAPWNNNCSRPAKTIGVKKLTVNMKYSIF